MRDNCQQAETVTVISPRSGWFEVNIAELWRYRDLIKIFVWRDFVAVYKQTILGPLWFLLQPLITTLVFTIIFGRIAKLPTDGVPDFLFYLSGVVAWNYFASCLNATSNTFISNAHLFGKVYFPRLAVPVSVIISNLMSFGIQFLLFLGFFLFYFQRGAQISPNNTLFMLPVLILQMAALALGVGILISSLTTKYRDLSYLISFGIQLWMFATPVVYPASQVPPQWQALYYLNPMVPVIETFRYAFLGSGSIHLWHLVIGNGITLLILLSAILVFNRIEQTFMDTV